MPAPSIETYAHIFSATEASSTVVHKFGRNRGVETFNGLAPVSLKTPEPDYRIISWASAWVTSSAADYYAYYERAGYVLNWAALTGHQGSECLAPIESHISKFGSMCTLKGPIVVTHGLALFTRPWVITSTDTLRVRVCYA